MESQPAISPEQAAILEILRDARQRYGPAALGRVEEAFFGSRQPPADKDEFQRPNFYFPGLTATPWHDPSDYAACTTLETHAQAIRDELVDALDKREGFQTYRQNRDYFVPKDHWKTMYFMVGGEQVNENRLLCPETARIIDSLPHVFGMVMFSALLPGGHIQPHCGPSNCRITIHLGLVVPPGCRLRVGRETREWESGKCLVFDDTFEHEAWNDSSSTRFVLFLDVWHPDLTEAEIDVLGRVQRVFSSGNHPQAIDRVLTDREEERGHSWWA